MSGAASDDMGLRSLGGLVHIALRTSDGVHHKWECTPDQAIALAGELKRLARLARRGDDAALPASFPAGSQGVGE